MSKTIYLAGKMSGKENWGKDEFDAAEIDLIKQNFVVINPFYLHAEPTRTYEEEVASGGWDAKWAAYLKKDIPELLKCDEVRVTGPDWVDSRGAKLEVQIASALFIPVKTLEGRQLTLGDIIPPLPKLEEAASEDVLAEAYRLTTGDRNNAYGDPTQDFKRTGTMWGAILGCDVTARHVALCMMALKISRACWSNKRDHYVDAAGYARCGWLCAEKEGTP